MTFLSSQLFSDTLGVRFFTVVASCITLLIIWRIADDDESSCLDCFVPRNDAKRPILFFILACSVVMFNLYGFVATPDTGLLLFSALFLFIYQRYLEKKSWSQALLMGLLMALMIYSKYHALLLLGLIVLSNLALLKRVLLGSNTMVTRLRKVVMPLKLI